MAEQEGGAELFAARPIANDVTTDEALADRAIQLGLQHRAAGSTPLGDAYYVYWDEGSARLLTALGATSPTTRNNAASRQRLVDAYCAAIEPAEASDIEAGS
jgi:hypothetical protein